MDACTKIPLGRKTPDNSPHSITLFFYEPTTWHGRVCCWIQRRLGFEQPYSHVVVGTSGGAIFDYTTAGIEVFYDATDVWLEYYREAADVRTYTVDDDNYEDLIMFLNNQLRDCFNIRWFDYAIPTLAYIIGLDLSWIPISCTAPALVALPIYTHPLSYLPGVLHKLLDIYEEFELQ